MSTKRELTPEEEAWRQKKLAWRQWERTTCTNLSPERLEEDLRHVDAEAKALKAKRRQSVVETVAELKRHKKGGKP